MLFIILGALIGAATGGFVGLLIGGLIGWFASQAIRSVVVGGLNIAQSKMIDSTFSIMGALCKADSVVTRDEIQAVEKMFDMLRLNSEQKRQAKDAFSRGKQPEFDLNRAVDDFAAITRRQGPLLQLFLQLQVAAVAADGVIHPAEHAMLVQIAQRLGLGERDIQQLEALLRMATGGGRSDSGAPTASRLDDAYTALGVTPQATPAEIKRAYRKLMSENHPDKLASRGLPESMRAVAEERSREINAAYDLLKEARGIK